MRERLERMLAPAVNTLGYELIKLEYVTESTGRVLRLYIDTDQGTNKGITVEDCARVSRQVSQVLDREDPIAEHYTLEVSSPGTD